LGRGASWLLTLVGAKVAGFSILRENHFGGTRLEERRTVSGRLTQSRVGVRGTGEVGRRLAAGFASRGHSVMIGSRDPDKPDLGEWLSGEGAGLKAGTFAETAAHGDLLVLAVLGTAAERCVGLGDDLHARTSRKTEVHRRSGSTRNFQKASSDIRRRSEPCRQRATLVVPYVRAW
jgi:NADP oxidoreductase coenzyme F420-dependent